MLPWMFYTVRERLILEVTWRHMWPHFWSTLSLHYTSNIFLGKLPYQRHHCREGTKNSRSEGFWLAKHKHINIPTMMEPFPPSAAWFWWTKIPHPQSLFKGGWMRLPSKGFSRINKIKEEIIYFYSLSLHYNNRSPVAGHDSQNGINCRRGGQHNIQTN
jgi:hypothetical protein